jgi:hypothetical protein
MSLYDVVLALHIMAVVIAFGLPLAAPVILPYLRRTHPRSLPAFHDVQYRMNTRTTGPGIVALFVFGAYMASKHHLWGEAWVQVPLTILVIIAVLGAWVVKALKRLAVLSRADIAASPGEGDVTWSEEHVVLYGRYMVAESLLGLLVLVAIFFMAAKP